MLNSLHPTVSQTTRRALISASLALLCGVLYYWLYRSAWLPPALQWLPEINIHVLPSDPTAGSLPSFTHALATLLLVYAIPVRGRLRMAAVAVSIGVLCLLEWSMGYVSAQDFLAIGLGSLLATALQTGGFTRRVATKAPASFGILFILVGSALIASGSYAEQPNCALYSAKGECIEYKVYGKPVYMSLERLRRAVRVEEARPLDRIGRLYTYGQYLFVNERNQGIHVIDNSEPADPVMLGFIRIPGNTEVAIRGGYLYADSYIDLVTLDLSDPASVTVVHRQEGIFPYDSFQNIPYNIDFRSGDLDRDRGVVVSYEL